MHTLAIIPLAGLFYLFCATSPRHPDNARIVYPAPVDSQIYNLSNGLRLTVKYGEFNKIRRTFDCAFICQLQNPGAQDQLLNRGDFFVRSSSGMNFVSAPFYTSHMSGLLLKVDKHPDQYPVAANSKGDYVFSWHSDAKMKDKEYQSHLAADTISLISKAGGAERVLLKLVWAKRHE